MADKRPHTLSPRSPRPGASSGTWRAADPAPRPGPNEPPPLAATRGTPEPARTEPAPRLHTQARPQPGIRLPALPKAPDSSSSETESSGPGSPKRHPGQASPPLRLPTGMSPPRSREKISIDATVGEEWSLGLSLWEFLDEAPDPASLSARHATSGAETERHGGQEPASRDPAQAGEPALDFYEFLRQERDPDSLRAQYGVAPQAGGRDGKKRWAAEHGAGARQGLRRRATMEAQPRPQAAETDKTERRRSERSRQVRFDVADAPARPDPPQPASGGKPRRGLLPPPAFTEDDEKAWQAEARVLASYRPLNRRQINNVKLVIACERYWLRNQVRSSAANAFARTTATCIWKGIELKSHYHALSALNQEVLRGSAIVGAFNWAAHGLAVDRPEWGRHPLPADEIAREVTGNPAYDKYLEPVLSHIFGAHASVPTTRLPQDMLNIAYALDYEVVKLCLETRGLEAGTIERFRRNMLVSALFLHGVMHHMAGLPGVNDKEATAQRLLRQVLNRKLNQDSGPFLASVMAESYARFPDGMKGELARRQAAARGREGFRGEAPGGISVELESLDAGLNAASPDKLQRQVLGFLVQLEMFSFSFQGGLAKLPDQFVEFSRNRLKDLTPEDILQRPFSLRCLDTIDRYRKRNLLDGQGKIRPESGQDWQALDALEREWRPASPREDRDSGGEEDASSASVSSSLVTSGEDTSSEKSQES